MLKISNLLLRESNYYYVFVSDFFCSVFLMWWNVKTYIPNEESRTRWLERLVTFGSEIYPKISERTGFEITLNGMINFLWYWIIILSYQCTIFLYNKCTNIRMLSLLNIILKMRGSILPWKQRMVQGMVDSTITLSIIHVCK